MSDRAVVAIAAAAALGAWWSASIPLPIAAAVVVVALAVRRPGLFVIGALVLAAALGARAWSGVEPVPPRNHDGWVTLVSDPEPTRSGTRAIVRADDDRLDLIAHGPSAGLLQARLAGERVRLSGAVRPLPPGSDWLRHRHVVGRLEVRHVESSEAGHPVTAAANQLRRVLTRGVAHLPRAERSLFTGLVLGDDRDQPPGVADDFRGAGLSHLLAVSGQNVAFVVAVASPLLARVGLRLRLVLTLCLLAFFALVTRFEPSVLRATAMAGAATLAATVGRPGTSIRFLALSVTGLVLVDPLLVHALAFRLSVAASAGILVAAEPLARRLPGPRWVVQPIAVTLAAQAGVAPIVVPTFGGLPVVSLPANLLAGPAAGPVMVWGMTGGLVAGLVGGPVAEWIHLPTGWLVGWIRLVARQAAALPLGELAMAHLLAIVVLAGLAVAIVRRGRTRGLRRAIVGAFAVVALLPATGVGHEPPFDASIAPGVHAWVGPDSSVVVAVDGRASAARALEALRRARIDRIDALVVRSDASRAVEVTAELRSRHRSVVTLVPEGVQLPDARTVEVAGVWRAGALTVDVRPNDGGLRLEVSRDDGV